jgi:hypothetical protein
LKSKQTLMKWLWEPLLLKWLFSLHTELAFKGNCVIILPHTCTNLCCVFWQLLSVLIDSFLKSFFIASAANSNLVHCDICRAAESTVKTQHCWVTSTVWCIEW